MKPTRLLCSWTIGLSLLGWSMAVSAVPAPLATAQRAFENGDALRAVLAFHGALAAGDATHAASLLDENAIIFEEGEAETTKAQYVTNHLPADIAFLRTIKEGVVSQSGREDKDMAWVATQGHMSGRYNNKDVDRFTTETMVLHRAAVGWRIVHIHWSSRAADAH